MMKILVCLAAVLAVLSGCKKAPPQAAGKPALTVQVVHPERRVWGERIAAAGSVAPWQETVIGAEIGGLKLSEVYVNVGDRVRRGDLLARFSAEMKQAELDGQQASFEDAAARFAEADANAQRASKIADSGAMSAQELQQLDVAAQTARAQMKLAKARLDAERLRFGYTRVEAPDDGLISSRTATVGAVVQSGAELFRMIRKGRLEWQAELPDYALQRVRVGQTVLIKGLEIRAHVVRISPVIDAQSRNGKVYVELPDDARLKAGMFVQGEFDLGKTPALVLPQRSVVMRDGYAYVYRLGRDDRVTQLKVATGRRDGEFVEISGDLAADAQIVSGGAGFLADGDLVRVEPAARPVGM